MAQIRNLIMSLKIIHTADWHLGQTFFGYDREEEHDAFLSWLIRTLTDQQADVLLIAGDVFDVANPSASSQHRFFRFLREANQQNPGLQIIITAGNHDSAPRLEAPVPLLEELNTHIVGIIRRKDDGSVDFDSLLIPLTNRQGERQALCMAVPFLRQGDYPPAEDTQCTFMEGVNRMYNQLYAYALQKTSVDEPIITMGHLHATGAELSEDDRSERIIMGGLESISADTFSEGLAYTALGHIHKAQRVGGRDNVRYAGSPLPMSFSEVNYNHQVVVVNIGADVSTSTSIMALPVPRTVDLIRIPKRSGGIEEVLEELADLPERDEKNDELFPFLEVRVLLTEPDPALRHKIEEVLVNKAVRLAAIVPSYPDKSDDVFARPLTYSDLQKIDPLDMLKHTFAARYGDEELPEEIEKLFQEVMREVSL